MLTQSNRVQRRMLQAMHGIACCVFLSALTVGVTGCATLDPDAEIKARNKICISTPLGEICRERETTIPGQTDRCTTNPGRADCLAACNENPVNVWCIDCIQNPEHQQCVLRRCMVSPHLPECQGVEVPKPGTAIVFQSNDMETYYCSRIEEMQEAGDLPLFDVDEFDISYSYSMDSESDTAAIMLELVTTSESDWDAINADWEEVDEAFDTLIDEYLEFYAGGE